MLRLRTFGSVALEATDGQAVGAVLAQPKRLALLAYLALNRRSFRREHLCELLWEIPDDPRGSLRWSLSKLRRLVEWRAARRGSQRRRR